MQRTFAHKPAIEISEENVLEIELFSYFRILMMSLGMGLKVGGVVYSRKELPYDSVQFIIHKMSEI